MKLKNGAQLTISKAAASDAAGIVEYLNMAGGESDNLTFGKDGFGTSAEEEEHYIRKVGASASSALFVGKTGGEIVSVGNIRAPGRERFAHQADIGMSVKKAYWGLGIGTYMMEAMIDFVKGNGITEIVHLGVRADNERAIRLYKKMGFEQIGVYKNFFKINGVYADEILMNLYL